MAQVRPDSFDHSVEALSNNDLPRSQAEPTSALDDYTTASLLLFSIKPLLMDAQTRGAGANRDSWPAGTVIDLGKPCGSPDYVVQCRELTSVTSKRQSPPRNMRPAWKSSLFRYDHRDSRSQEHIHPLCTTEGGQSNFQQPPVLKALTALSKSSSSSSFFFFLFSSSPTPPTNTPQPDHSKMFPFGFGGMGMGLPSAADLQMVREIQQQAAQMEGDPRENAMKLAFERGRQAARAEGGGGMGGMGGGVGMPGMGGGEQGGGQGEGGQGGGGQGGGMPGMFAGGGMYDGRGRFG